MAKPVEGVDLVGSGGSLNHAPALGQALRLLYAGLSVLNKGATSPQGAHLTPKAHQSLGVLVDEATGWTPALTCVAA